MGLKEKEGRDFSLGKLSGTGATTSGIGLTTCRIMKIYTKMHIVSFGKEWSCNPKNTKNMGNVVV